MAHKSSEGGLVASLLLTPKPFDISVVAVFAFSMVPVPLTGNSRPMLTGGMFCGETMFPETAASKAAEGCASVAISISTGSIVTGSVAEEATDSVVMVETGSIVAADSMVLVVTVAGSTAVEVIRGCPVILMLTGSVVLPRSMVVVTVVGSRGVACAKMASESSCMLL